MKNLWKQIGVGLLLSLSINANAGKTAGDSEIVTRGEDGKYSLVSSYVDFELGNDFEIPKEIKEYTIRLIENADRYVGKPQKAAFGGRLLDVPVSDLLSARPFQDALFSNLNEYYLVEESQLKCEDYSDVVLPDYIRDTTKLACNQGHFLFINEEVAADLTNLEFALLLIHEGLHRFNPSFNHIQIADVIQAIMIVETRIIPNLDSRDLVLNEKEIKTLERYSKRIAQLYKKTDYEAIQVTPGGVIVSPYSSFEIQDEEQFEPSFVYPGTTIQGSFILKNTQLKNSGIYAQRDIDNGNGIVVLEKMKITNSQVAFSTKKEWREALVVNKPFLTKGLEEIGLEVKDGKLIESKSSKRLVRALRKSDSNIYKVLSFVNGESQRTQYLNSVIENSNLVGISYIENSRLSECNAKMSLYSFSSYCEKSNLQLAWLSNSRVSNTIHKIGNDNGTILYASSNSLVANLKLKGKLYLDNSIVKNSTFSGQILLGKKSEIIRSNLNLGEPNWFYDPSSKNIVSLEMSNSNIRANHFEIKNRRKVILKNSKIDVIDGSVEGDNGFEMANMNIRSAHNSGFILDVKGKKYVGEGKFYCMKNLDSFFRNGKYSLSKRNYLDKLQKYECAVRN